MMLVVNILSQHAEEAAMLWLLRRGAATAPHYSLPDLAKLDGRVEAHIDGLRIAGDAGWQICEEQLAVKEHGEVFAAAVLAFESGRADRVKKVMAFVEEEPQLMGALVSALGWLSFDQAKAYISGLLQSPNPVHQRVGIATAAVHRRHPGEALGSALNSPEPALRARALKAAGELQDRSLERALGAGLTDVDPDCRFWAAWSGMLFGTQAALRVLTEVATSDSPRAKDAAGLALRRMDISSAHALHKYFAADSNRIRLAITAAGVIGDPALVQWLITLMGQLPMARLAGEAFTMITGVDLAWKDLECKPPEDFDAGPTEDPNDENVAMDPDDNLPWPHPALVQKWWEQNKTQFQTGTRHLLGKPMTTEWLKTVLRDARQRQRAAAALELAIREPARGLFNIRAPGSRQIELLGKPGPDPARAFI